MDKRSCRNFFTLILFMAFLACSKSNEADLQKQNNVICNTTNIRFSSDIAPILQDNCNFCHNTASALVGVNTDNYNSVKILADKGSLLGTITHTGNFVPMPLGRSKIAECDIKKISAWITAGTPNN